MVSECLKGYSYDNCGCIEEESWKVYPTKVMDPCCCCVWTLFEGPENCIYRSQKLQCSSLVIIERRPPSKAHIQRVRYPPTKLPLGKKKQSACKQNTLERNFEREDEQWYNLMIYLFIYLWTQVTNPINNGCIIFNRLKLYIYIYILK